MDWQTKEYIDSRLDDVEEKIDLILEHLNINTEGDLDSEDQEDSQTEEEDII